MYYAGIPFHSRSIAWCICEVRRRPGERQDP